LQEHWGCVIAIVAFVAFAVRHGMKVKKKPEGVTPETIFPIS